MRQVGVVFLVIVALLHGGASTSLASEFDPVCPEGSSLVQNLDEAGLPIETHAGCFYVPNESGDCVDASTYYLPASIPGWEVDVCAHYGASELPYNSGEHCGDVNQNEMWIPVNGGVVAEVCTDPTGYENGGIYYDLPICVTGIFKAVIGWVYSLNCITADYNAGYTTENPVNLPVTNQLEDAVANDSIQEAIGEVSAGHGESDLMSNSGDATIISGENILIGSAEQDINHSKSRATSDSNVEVIRLPETGVGISQLLEPTGKGWDPTLFVIFFAAMLLLAGALGAWSFKHRQEQWADLVDREISKSDVNKNSGRHNDTLPT